METLWSGGSTWKCAKDGGLKGNIGTCGLVLWNVEEDREIFTAMIAEECGLEMLHSTREELRGNLAAEVLFDICNKQFGDDGHNAVEYICDSKSAVEALEKDIGRMKAMMLVQAEMDIILEINRLRCRNEGITRQFKWARNHQEEKKPQC